MVMVKIVFMAVAMYIVDSKAVQYSTHYVNCLKVDIM